MNLPAKLSSISASSIITRGLGALLAIALLGLAFVSGGYINQQYSQPEVLTRYEVIIQEKVVEKEVYIPVEKEIETIVYEPLETIVYETVETPVEVSVIQQLTEFESLAALQQWLGTTKLIDMHFNVVDLEDNSIKEFDCDDYAQRLQDKAFRDGYILSFEVIHSTEYNSLFKEKKLPAGAIHAINTAVIGNSVYYVEPQTQETVFVANLD